MGIYRQLGTNSSSNPKGIDGYFALEGQCGVCFGRWAGPKSHHRDDKGRGEGKEGQSDGGRHAASLPQRQLQEAKGCDPATYVYFLTFSRIKQNLASS